jgi:hypothetical protein
MVKLVDTPDLGSGAARRGGSSPLPGTNYQADCVAVCTALIKRDIGFCSPCKTIEQMVPRSKPEQVLKLLNIKGIISVLDRSHNA